MEPYNTRTYENIECLEDALRLVIKHSFSKDSSLNSFTTKIDDGDKRYKFIVSKEDIPGKTGE